MDTGKLFYQKMAEKLAGATPEQRATMMEQIVADRPLDAKVNEVMAFAVSVHMTAMTLVKEGVEYGLFSRVVARLMAVYGSYAETLRLEPEVATLVFHSARMANDVSLTRRRAAPDPDGEVAWIDTYFDFVRRLEDDIKYGRLGK